MAANAKVFSNDFYQSVEDELFKNILPYWEKYSRDNVNKGFYGRIDNDNNLNTACERSIVMTSRFLWTYSCVALFKKDKKYLEMADFAYDVIINKFWDKKHGGVYWSVMPDGKPKVSKKQIYGEAFCCYGLSEYAAALKELRNDEETSQQAMNYALDLYNFMENYAYDPEAGGYVEARAENWKKTKDMILSPKDMNCPKSMNTNLHVMEAYTNLYRRLPVVFEDSKAIRLEVGDSLSKLVRTTVDCIVQKNMHLGMFFDMDWNLLSDEISYGHDIEASWLLWEAAEELGDKELQEEIRDSVIKMAEVTLNEGFDQENGCLENFMKDNGTVKDRTRVWWNQAESMNGFYNAWEMTGDSKYSDACLKQWNWILTKQADRKGGDWWASLDAEGNPVLSEAKGGNWKTSYHNGRTCLELLRRSKYGC
jgi:mannobiose 2-epimerase